MVNTPKIKSLVERELENADFRRAYEESYEAFQLEVQILQALEAKKWSYSDLAKATKTSKSNVSRDLSAGGILSASFLRIGRIADALGMRLVGLLIPKEHVAFVLPQIEELVRESTNAAFGMSKLLPTPHPSPTLAPSVGLETETASSRTASTSISLRHNLIPA